MSASAEIPKSTAAEIRERALSRLERYLNQYLANSDLDLKSFALFTEMIDDLKWAKEREFFPRARDEELVHLVSALMGAQVDYHA